MPTLTSMTNALASEGEVKGFLGITSNENDVTLRQLIIAVSALIEGFCRSIFVQRTITEYHDGGTGAQSWFLEYTPIVSITSIVAPDGDTITSEYYGVFKDTGILRYGGCWPTAWDSNGQRAPWTVTYVAGRWAATEDVHERLKLALAVEISTRWTANRDGMKDPAQIVKKTVDGLSVEYAQPQSSQFMAASWYRSALHEHTQGILRESGFMRHDL